MADGTSFVRFSGYTAGQNGVSVVIGEGTGAVVNASITATNHASGKAQIIKTNSATGAPVGGVVFRVSNDNDFTDNDGDLILTSSAIDGTVTTTWIEPGTYYVKEVSVPNGFFLDETVKTVVVPALGMGTVSFVTICIGKLALTKLDLDTNLPISGVTFEIWPDGNEAAKITKTTDGDGIIELELEAGAYKAREISAPDGYTFDTEEVFDITIQQDKTTAITKYNTPHCELILKKVNADDPTQTLPGASFKLERYKDESVVETKYITLGESGILGVDLTPGTWVVTETAAPDGYIVDATPQEITLELYDQGELTFSNAPTEVVILKLDADTEETLEGAVFKIVDEQENVVIESVTTDEFGQITIKALPAGNYYAIEISAPEGYRQLAEPIAFTVGDENGGCGDHQRKAARRAENY
jgi:uncharacterized surface anchored protein